MPINSIELYSFIVVMMLMIITPGTNQLLVLQSGLVIGHKAALYNVLGISSSMFVHALLSGLGVSLLIMQSPGLHSLIKVLGSGYIIYLAVNSLLSAYRLHRANTVSSQAAASLNEAIAESGVRSFTKGFTTNILNIQTSFIFLSIFPQYMNQLHSLFLQALSLTLVFIALLLGWYSLFIALIFKVRHHLLHPKVQIRIKAVTGTFLLAMGIKMLFSQ